MGLMGHKREAHQPTGGWCTPPLPCEGGRLGLGEGGWPPFPSPSPLLPFPPVEGKGGILLGLLVQFGPAHGRGGTATP